MGLFSKKKEETKSCCCGGNCTPETMAQAEAAKAAVGVKVLGTGCAKCNALENAVRAALTELGMDTTIDHVTDFTQIAAYGVMTTPALVVDGKVVSYGKVLKKEVNLWRGNVVAFPRFLWYSYTRKPAEQIVSPSLPLSWLITI